MNAKSQIIDQRVVHVDELTKLSRSVGILDFGKYNVASRIGVKCCVLRGK